MPQAPPQPSSLSCGFFQALPTVLPPYSSPYLSTNTSQASTSDDPILPRITALYLTTPTPAHISQHLHNLSRQALHPSTLLHTIDADTNPPTLHPLTTFGTPNVTNPLQTSSGWRALKRMQTSNGIVGHGYHQPTNTSITYNQRIHQFLALHIWGPSSAVATCPTAMTDGAAVLIRQQLLHNPSLSSSARTVLSAAFQRLTSLDPDVAWTSGQWMTERSGGSDVRGTETIARRLQREGMEEDELLRKDVLGNDLGEWRVDGFKWFSSATDADCVVLLAQTTKGLSAFFAPMRVRRLAPRSDETGANNTTEMNGIFISRLKSKLGTKAVPTAELEIRGMRAYLLGEEGQGVKIISSVLNITRLWTASGGTSAWGRGLAVSRAFTRVRKVKGGGLLSANRQHVRWMADETMVYRAMTALYMFGVALLGYSEGGSTGESKAMEWRLLSESQDAAEKLLRLLTPVMKSCCSLRAVEGLRACMESLGGVGYCENNEDGGVLNIARLFRDANVNPIWEGTGSVLAEDLLRALKVGRPGARKEFEGGFGKWVEEVCARIRNVSKEFSDMTEAVMVKYQILKNLVVEKSEEELLWQGRVVVRCVEAIVCAVLLMADAAQDGDDVALAVAKRWVRMKVEKGSSTQDVDWKTESEMDRRIFLGDGSSQSPLAPKL